MGKKKDNKELNSFNKFSKRVGMLKTKDVKKLKGLPKAEDYYNDYPKFSQTDLKQLQSFCKKNPAYHIVTWLNTDGFELNENDEECVCYFENAVRFVNREGYFLAKGDNDPEIILLEYDYCPRDEEGNFL